MKKTFAKTDLSVDQINYINKFRMLLKISANRTNVIPLND